MKKEDGCHKNQKTVQRTKRGRKGQKQDGRRQKEAKKGHKLGHIRAVQKDEKEW